jgi:hypothetical protein
LLLPSRHASDARDTRASLLAPTPLQEVTEWFVIWLTLK